MTDYIEAPNTYPDSPEYAEAMAQLSAFSASFHGQTLAEARADFHTQIAGKVMFDEPAIAPPPSRFDTLTYRSGTLDLPLFVTPKPNNGEKYPAVVYLFGGETNNLAEFWLPVPIDRDQIASQFQRDEIVAMYPGLRGGNQNDGQVEYNFDEVEDVINATKHLASLPYVDENRIYLVGHSAGGTLALLISEIASQSAPALFHSVICYGSAEIINTPGIEFHTQLFENTTATDADKHEMLLRAPYFWLDDITTPTWLVEGIDGGNIEPLRNLAEKGKNNPNLNTLLVDGHNHFTVLAPMNTVIAEQIVADEAILLSNEAILSLRR